MTVPVQTPFNNYVGNGATVAFPYAFLVLLSADLVVKVSGVTLVNGVDYTVSGLGLVSGGTVTMTSAPASLAPITIYRSTSITRAIDYQSNGDFLSPTVNSDFDRIWLVLQELFSGPSGFGRMVKAPVGETIGDLPAASVRAGNLLSFDSSGNPLAVAASAQSATQLTIDLASSVLATKNAGQVGFNSALAYAAGTIGGFLNSLIASTGASFIGFIQSGVGAVLRTLQSKAREWPSVQDYGAVGDGVTLDTAAFTAAQTAHAFVRVPAGMNCKVAAGLNYWQFFGDGAVFENGQQWQLSRTAQTEAAGKVYRQRTFGTFEDAVGDAVSINSTTTQLRSNTQVNGTTTQGMAILGEYGHVASYRQAYSFEPDLTSAATTYTANTLTDANVGTFNATAGRIKQGMLVKTKHASAYTGRVQSVAGNVITVDAWYITGTGVAGTPANGTGALINPNTKIWGMNINVFPTGTAANNQAQKAAGIELDISCDPTVGAGVWGYDVVTTGGKPEMHFISRGSRTYAFYAQTGADFGFVSNTNTTGFDSQDNASFDYSTKRSGTQRWTVGQGALQKDYVSVQGLVASSAIATDITHVIATGTGQTYTLETPVGKVGRKYTVRSLNANTLATAAANIDAAPTKAMVANTTYTVVSDGANWISF